MTVGTRAAPAWIAALAPERETGIAPASGPALLAVARERLGDGPVEWVVELGSRMAERIIREMPVYGGGAEAFNILRMGTESSTLQFLLNLVTGATSPIATDEALDGAIDFARRGIGLEAVLRGTRLGHRSMSESFLAACERLADPRDRVADMQYLTARLFEFMDAFAAELAGQYIREQMRWSASDTAARLEFINTVLGGTEPAPETALRTLRYDLAARHLALIAWSHRNHIDVDAAVLQDACATLLKRLDAGRRLIIPVGAGRVWAWGEVAGSPAAIEAIVQAARIDLPDGVYVAVGSPAPGPAGFRASHLEAAAIERLLPSAPGSVTAYSSVDMLTLLLEDDDRATSFAKRELGPLYIDSPSHRDLRATLAAFLDEQGSTQAAAQRLMIARNTVSYRVRRAEEIMGRSIRHRSLQLRAALLIADAPHARPSGT